MIEVVAQLLISANPSSISSTRSGPPDGCNAGAEPATHTTVLIDGENRLQTCLIQSIIESSSESSPYHCRSVHQRRDSSPGEPAARRAQTIRDRRQMSPNPQSSNSFRHQS